MSRFDENNVYLRGRVDGRIEFSGSLLQTKMHMPGKITNCNSLEMCYSVAVSASLVMPFLLCNLLCFDHNNVFLFAFPFSNGNCLLIMQIKCKTGRVEFDCFHL